MAEVSGFWIRTGIYNHLVTVDWLCSINRGLAMTSFSSHVGWQVKQRYDRGRRNVMKPILNSTSKVFIPVIRLRLCIILEHVSSNMAACDIMWKHSIAKMLSKKKLSAFDKTKDWLASHSDHSLSCELSNVLSFLDAFVHNPILCNSQLQFLSQCVPNSHLRPLAKACWGGYKDTVPTFCFFDVLYGIRPGMPRRWGQYYQIPPRQTFARGI